MTKKLKILNRSNWPDWAVEVIAPWIVKRAGITWDYKILLRHTKRNTWWGRGGKYQQATNIHRRYAPGGRWCFHNKEYREVEKKENLKYKWPYIIKEHRYKTIDFSVEIKSRLELLVFLLAHEACHANRGHPTNWKKDNGHTNEKYMELECDEEAIATVVAFRENWKFFYYKLKESSRKHFYKNKKPSKTEVLESKKVKTFNLLSKWEKKLKTAQKKVKRYNRLVNTYDNKLAALGRK